MRRGGRSKDLPRARGRRGRVAESSAAGAGRVLRDGILPSTRNRFGKRADGAAHQLLARLVLVLPREPAAAEGELHHAQDREAPARDH